MSLEFVEISKKQKNVDISTHGLIDNLNHPGYIRYWLDVNTFEENWKKIPDGYTSKQIPKYYEKDYYDPSKIELLPNNSEYLLIKEKYGHLPHFKTLNNGGHFFLYYVDFENNNIYIFKNENEIEDSKYYLKKKITDQFIEENKWFFIKNVCNYMNVMKIYIGKSPANSPNDDGNTTLLQIRENEYVFIGCQITHFKVQEGHTIKEYVSTVGNADVPYAFAIDNFNWYYLFDGWWEIITNPYDKSDPYDDYRDDKSYNVRIDKINIIEEIE